MLLFATIQILVLSSVEVFANTNPVVENVAFEISGTTVTVTYDLSDVDATDTEFTVYMEVSEDGGTTWNYGYGSASGDIGTSVAKGIGKTITWTYNGSSSGTMKIKILADDLFGDQIYYERKIYNTVTIGTQTWLKENLNVGTKINSTAGGYQQTNNSIIEKYCYNNDESNCDTYGGLYEWTEAMQYVTTPGTQGICPSGWHIPTKGEYKTLQTYVGDQSVKLIDESQTRSGYTFTNETGFSALFASYRLFSNGSFYDFSLGAYFWSSSVNASNADYVRLYYLYSYVYISNNNKSYGYSVRCLKD